MMATTNVSNWIQHQWKANMYCKNCDSFQCQCDLKMSSYSATTSAFKESEEKRKERIVQNPDNGRTGWWTVIGLRHSAIAKASSASEAIQKALSAGLIGDWECPEASFRMEDLPDVFST
jgi:hypothetical protein